MRERTLATIAIQCTNVPVYSTIARDKVESETRSNNAFSLDWS